MRTSTSPKARYWANKLLRARYRGTNLTPDAFRILELCAKETRLGYLSETERDERSRFTGVPWRTYEKGQSLGEQKLEAIRLLARAKWYLDTDACLVARNRARFDASGLLMNLAYQIAKQLTLYDFKPKDR